MSVVSFVRGAWDKTKGWVLSILMGLVMVAIVAILGLSVYTSHENSVLLKQVHAETAVIRADQISGHRTQVLIVRLVREDGSISYYLAHHSTVNTPVINELCRLTPGCRVPPPHK